MLANEEVIDGRSERGSHPVIRMPLKQWMLRITSYAERLLYDLEDLDWSESIKDMQRNWIGRSEGATIKFKLCNSEQYIEVYTTRPDTIFGCAFIGVAYDHNIINYLNKTIEIENFINECRADSLSEAIIEKRADLLAVTL